MEKRTSNDDKPKRGSVGLNPSLTRRQCEIAALVATGASNKEIAHQLAISCKTVKNTLTTVFQKTKSRSRTELAVKWLTKSNPPIFFLSDRTLELK